MIEKSSNFVKVAFADKNKILHQLADYTIKVKQSRLEVEKIGLFGSYATDTFGPASDVDLLIILRQSSKRFLDRIPDYLPENLICKLRCFSLHQRGNRENDTGRYAVNSPYT